MKFILLLLFTLVLSCQHGWGPKKQHKIPTQQPPRVATPIATPTIAPPPVKKTFPSVKIEKFCLRLKREFNRYSWSGDPCASTNFKHVRNSVQDRPLLWKVYGDESAHKKKGLNTTMIMCGVHGDEITTIKFCFDIIEDLESTPSLYKDRLVVVAPLVSPDAFLKRRPTRTNARGVDPNRNFPTRDWKRKAIKIWKSRYRSDKRRYPGRHALSEPEVLFQMNLILRYKPDKIISVHAPLSMLDYDGPEGPTTPKKGPKVTGKKANQLLIAMSKKANKYRIINYPFFPGSLGNWAGNERNIPTYTLELPTTDYTKTNEYWRLFKDAIRRSITEDLVLGRGEKNEYTPIYKR